MAEKFAGLSVPELVRSGQVGGRNPPRYRRAKVGGQRKVGCWESTPWQGDTWLSIRGIEVWSAGKLSSSVQASQGWWTGA